MSVVVEGVYDRGIVTLKNEVNIPDKTDVLVIINDRRNKENFLKSAGSWKGVDLSIFDEILDSRKVLENNVKPSPTQPATHSSTLSQ